MCIYTVCIPGASVEHLASYYSFGSSSIRFFFGILIVFRWVHDISCADFAPLTTCLQWAHCVVC
jgi:hypothetical protein